MKERFLFVVVLLVAGCKDKPGAACSNAGVCDGRDKALLCVEGKYLAASCAGPDGCTGSPFACDFRGSAAGADCVAAPGAGSRCAADGKARIECVKGKVSREECDGPRGCYPRTNGTSVACDATLKAGGACHVDGDWCSTDGKDWLTCSSGKLTVAGKCRGAGGCRTVGDGVVACDVSVAAVGDPCATKVSACTSDATTVLACKDGAMRVETVCASGKACRHAEGTTACAAK